MSETPMISIANLNKHYPVRRGARDLFRQDRQVVRAVDGISLDVASGEILGLAGESGSGKTTTGEIIVRLQEATAGEITVDGHPLEASSRKDRKRFRREVQMIFQDPYETLNPRFTVFETIAEPLRIHGLKDKGEIARRVTECLTIAGLKPAEHYLDRFPHEMSGGQRQRVAIARGIVLRPKVLIADEPVSMLDVSIRADILNLLKRLRDEMGLTMIYVSHDLATIKYLCDRIAVMYLGKIVEIGDAEDVIAHPQHPYTQVLVSSVPVADPDYQRQEVTVDDAVPDQINLPEGCRFTPRCPYAQPACLSCDHELVERRKGQQSACIFSPEELRPRSIA
ncbi:oligopeptide ABC transporter ATP-binding protein [Alkalispirochaeta sphaeroplastigenens]|uniref:Oligopeptide ABC transporter ATP-binding protein n=1 Tax=Alkalispirochaeta sphaeroplastigenens TaxID=1187066 RepID=A0A2S4JT32_9SPIO|nr:oligopeptide/dipeptide ABC transporter ATP-binding protein [Alkalispirochaeta sphaeroplastigenens]POR02630.1 oligopeptide ABC transporter ATP-binding protein [Alkalispirochaeta sphaeroplastigenens]